MNNACKMTLIFAIALCGCRAPSQKDAKEGAERYLTYSRDSRTGLCFAVYDAYSVEGLAFTSVPCTPDVLREIGK